MNGRHLRLAGLVSLISVLVTVGLVLPGSALGTSASLSVSASSPAVQGSAVTLTVEGVSNASDLLFVFIDPSGHACADNPNDEYWLSDGSSADPEELSNQGGDTVATGAFTASYSFTPPSAGQAVDYSVCAYLDTSSTGTPDAAWSGSVTAERPTGTITITTNPTPVDTRPTTISVSGTTQAANDLRVYVNPPTGSCGSDPLASQNDSATQLTPVGGGQPEPAGTFAATYTFVPDKGPYEVCAYLDPEVYWTADAVGTAEMTATAHAAITAVAPADQAVVEASPVRLTFTVTSLAPRTNATKIWLTSDPGRIGRSHTGALAGSWSVGSHTVAVPVSRPGTYYWAVWGTDHDGSIGSSTHTVVVQSAVPRQIRLRVKERRPRWGEHGRVRLKLSTGPWDSVRISYGTRRHRLGGGSFRASPEGKLAIWWPVRCPASGRFQIAVTASDGRGQQLTRHAHYFVPSCGSKPKPKAGSPGSGGSGGGFPSSGTCTALGSPDVDIAWQGITHGCTTGEGVYTMFVEFDTSDALVTLNDLTDGFSCTGSDQAAFCTNASGASVSWQQE